MTKIVTRVSIMGLAYLLAYVFLARYFGSVYASYFPESISSSFVPSAIGAWVIGLPLAVIFTLVFLMHAVGGQRVWLWTIVALVPAILFEILFDILHLYIPIILGLIAWGLGSLAHKALIKLNPSFMAKIS